jgi:hypothetical protein
MKIKPPSPDREIIRCIVEDHSIKYVLDVLADVCLGWAAEKEGDNNRYAGFLRRDAVLLRKIGELVLDQSDRYGRDYPAVIRPPIPVPDEH